MFKTKKELKSKLSRVILDSKILRALNNTYKEQLADCQEALLEAEQIKDAQQLEKTGEVYGIFVEEECVYIGETGNKQGFCKAREYQRRCEAKHSGTEPRDLSHKADWRVGSLMAQCENMGLEVETKPIFEFYGNTVGARKDCEKKLIETFKPEWNIKGGEVE